MAKAKTGVYDIPFDKNGDQLHWADQRYDHGVAWKPNEEFSDALRFDSYGRGQSAAYFIFRNANGQSRIMFMTDLSDAMPHIVRGILTGTFTYVKRGRNFGVRFLSE